MFWVSRVVPRDYSSPYVRDKSLFFDKKMEVDNMEKFGLNVIRKMFYSFFEEKGHLARQSYSLVPNNDKSLLLVNSGMAPLKPYFVGIDMPPKQRMVTCQKCIRTGDIENVGKTARHATFFEMLGNFSFGDYFKKEAIEWSWEFSTEYLKMPEDKLWITIYENDDDAYEIWNKDMKIPAEKIVRLGKADNFWEIGLGPCGPCSEIYYDRGEKHGCSNEHCKPGCDCDRYVEFWNLVFTQFDKDEEGNYSPLPKPNIDTGMGLERVACILQEVNSIFEVDTVKTILDEVVQLSNQPYGIDSQKDISIRIITDHIRSVTFMVSDGIMPSNEGRGYVLRRLLRRAARHGRLLGIKDSFLVKLIYKVIEVSGEAYPELLEKTEFINKVISIEEERFQETIDQGSEILKGYINELKDNNHRTLSGENVFKLYDTFGFPLELTKEILEEEYMLVDEDGFKIEMTKQRERGRAARQNSEEEGWKEDVYAQLSIDVRSRFDGYEKFCINSKVLALVKNGEIAQSAVQGDHVTILLDMTNFYPESGGQMGDQGMLSNENCKIKITDCKKGNNDRILLIGEVTEGNIVVGTVVKSQINTEKRLNTMRNHTATHLLHKALRNILGQHIEQSGSLVTSEKLRFDFSHFQPLTYEELQEIERLINAKVLEGLPVNVQDMSIEEAKKNGATALFGEKYGENVRVVSVGDYSMELCGGTHLSNTSQIGLFKIITEGGVAAGIRRIEAVTGITAYEITNQKEELLLEIARRIKANSKELLAKVDHLVEDNRALQKELDVLRSKLASSYLDDIINSKVIVKDVNIITYKLNDIDMDQLRELGDKIKDKLGTGIVVLGSKYNEKVNFIGMATEDVVKKGVHAGLIIKQVAQLAGGGGGGKSQMAQAGAKDSSKIDEALGLVVGIVDLQLK